MNLQIKCGLVKFVSPTLVTTLAAVVVIATSADSQQTCGFVRRLTQAESRDAYGRIIVEASVIYEVNCNGRQFYIYDYIKRPGCSPEGATGPNCFRAIRVPDWGRAIGGRDFSSYAEAIAAAAAAASGGGSTPTDSRGELTGKWKGGYRCGYGGWGIDVQLTEGSNGAFTGTVTGQTSGTIEQGVQQGNNVSFVMRVAGGSVQQWTGQIQRDSGALKITGKMYENGKQVCDDFSLTKQ